MLSGLEKRLSGYQETNGWQEFMLLIPFGAEKDRTEQNMQIRDPVKVSSVD